MEKNNLIISKASLSEINEIVTLQSNNNNTLLSESSITEDFENNNAIYYIARIDNILTRIYSS